MKIGSVSTSPNFGSTVRYIHNEKYVGNLLKDKHFAEFIDKLANDGKNSTVVFIPDKDNIWCWDRFASVSGIKDRETGKWISYKDLLGIGLNNHVDCLEVNKKIQKKLIPYISVDQYNREAKEKYSPLNGLDHGYLNISVTDEIDGKVHMAHGTLRMDQDADRAAFEYLSVKSILPDNPTDVDTRLNKYLNPKPEQRVTLMYEDSRKDLYKNEDFVGFVEWLDTSKSQKDNQQIIVKPRQKIDKNDKMNFIDIITVQPSPYKSMFQNCRNILQHFYGGLLWYGSGFDSAKIKNDLDNIYRSDRSTYPDLIKPFNVCI